MNPYLPPASPLAADEDILDLVRLGHCTGTLTAAAYLFAVSGWVIMALNLHGPFRKSASGPSGRRR